MKFVKMQGIGNDYVYMDCTKINLKNIPELAVKLSNRNYGVGSDGLILIKSSDKADFMMDMYNADGSRSQMCGNGIRCVGKYVYDFGLTKKEEITVETLAGIKELKLIVKDGQVDQVTVNMGEAILDPKLIPINIDEEVIINHPIIVGGDEYKITGVGMGNPHAVVFVNEVENLELEDIGPLFESHEVFPERVNTEFIRLIDESTLEMRVWERGSGETLACGTGACASVVAAVLNGLTKEEVIVKLLGGDLKIHYKQDENIVYMTGPCSKVFEGEIDIGEYIDIKR